MSRENNKNEHLQALQQGTGSAENRGQDRKDQQQPNVRLNDEQREDISNQLGNDKNRVADISELGMLSGRDDAAGGSGDRMEKEDTGKNTDQ